MRTSLYALAVTMTVAPFVFVQTAAAGDGMMKSNDKSGMKADISAMVGETVTLGNLTIAAPFARATLPNQPVAGGFMTITNAGDADDRLVAVSSPAAGRMEIHEMKMDGDVMRMREIEGGLVVPAGETVTLEPGGYHIMFMDLAGPFVEGDVQNVTLTFETAGEVDLSLPVVELGKGGMGHGQMKRDGSGS